MADWRSVLCHILTPCLVVGTTAPNGWQARSPSDTQKIMKWATSDDLGCIAFNTKGAAMAAYPSRTVRRCTFAMGFLGWLSLEMGGTDNSNTIKTPDGREIPVVSGYSSEHGRLVGMKGGTPRNQFNDAWRAIMGRVIESALALHVYTQTL